MKKALVLGGGIQGCCVALMLKKHGYEVSLIDKNENILNRASLNGTGKIHLGFVFGADPSLKTGKNLLLSALYFAPYLEYLLDAKVDWEKFKSTSFNYLVAKDSMLSPTQVNAYFQTLEDSYLDHIKNKNLMYLGKRPQKLFQETTIPEQVNPDLFQACFATEEVCLYLESFNEVIKKKIQSENIPLYLNRRVTNVKRIDDGFIVDANSGDGSNQIKSDLVFSCLWEGNMDLDKKMGIMIKKDYNLRLKFGIITKSPLALKRLSSFTIIQGPYGDYVSYPQRNAAYFSWYPSSMKGMLVDQKMPSDWDALCDGHIPDTMGRILVNENNVHFSHLIPDLPEFETIAIRSGVIVANGYSDIYDVNSKLHERNEFPIMQNDGYFSINTGKLTNAPRNTYLLEKMLGHENF
ncbi:putative FAD dependent oxidoreductase [Nitrosotalea sinensis]|uniref:Putative FAD dependent oxidoreductase n=1 Tax=Nitrosotalea sinensis TaxID=1499975 RepID=A0A2H1EED8_9ARCH|nr:FAD-dependent oxidoreductase [Candidatus Nitrosotalea sinensis]SHO42873.1 putative FAD dependent oxidoreductase [Candidatus Nitrosotalea sinensis]